MGKRLEIKKGAVYGILTVMKEGELLKLPSGQVNRTITCKCSCGNVKDIRLLHLKRGRITSCGCSVKTMGGESFTDIGRLYRSMKYRCTKKYNKDHCYYDKGITVCDEWLNNFFTFKDWCIKNGYDKSLQIDRIDNSKGYNPNNCRFVTNKVNSNNRDNTFYVVYKNKKVSLMLLLEELNHPNKANTIMSRIKRGWDVEKAIFQKPANNYINRTK